MPSSFLHNAEVVVTTQHTSSGGTVKRFRNVYHYGCATSSAFIFSAIGLAQQVYNTITALIVPLTGQSYTVTTITARLMDDSTLLPVTAAVVGLPATGTAATGDTLPEDMAVVMQLKTGLRGRSYRGSKHYPGVPEASTTAEELSGASATAWIALKAPHAASLAEGANTWVPTVISTTQSTLINPTNIVATTITSAVLNKTIGTMRRRREETVTA